MQATMETEKLKVAQSRRATNTELKKGKAQSWGEAPALSRKE